MGFVPTWFCQVSPPPTRASHDHFNHWHKLKVISPIHETSLRRSGIARTVKGHHSITIHTLRFTRNRNEPYLPLPSQSQLVLIYRSRRDGRLSRPRCEVAQAEIRTCSLPITNPTLYHTSTSASKRRKCRP